MCSLITFRTSFIGLLFYGVICFSQEAAETRFQVLDKSTEKPVVYATVILKQSKIGVVSDDNGNFRIPSIYKSKQDSLKISCIGYSTITIAMAKQKEGVINTIFLNPRIETLAEINLFLTKKRKKIPAKKIVKEAIHRIPINFPTEPFSYIGYYRDYQQVADRTYLNKLGVTDKNTYINLNEGVIQVYDAGFGTNRLTDQLNQTVLYEFKKNLDFPVDTLLTAPYDNRKEKKIIDGIIISPLGGNEMNLLYLTNALRNYNRMSFSFVNVFNKHFIDNHYFKLDKVLYLDDEAIYSIDFKSNRSVNSDFNAMGKILISKENFGIYNLDYKMLKGKDNLIYRVNIAYKPIDDQYYLNYLTFNNYFEVKGGDFFKVDRVVYEHQNSSFLVFFNEEIDPKSIGSWQKQFQFISNREAIQIEDVFLIEPEVLKIRITTSAEIEEAILNDNLRYEIKKLRDVKGRLLNDQKYLRADQFREIFVQKVLKGTGIDNSYNFINKELPLKASELNAFKGSDTYWINTPLKQSK